MSAFADSLTEMQQGLAKAPPGKAGVELAARRERARRALQGMARLGGTEIPTSRAATRPTTTST